MQPKPLITCQLCGAGNLTPRKRYRMSMPVVVIGWILLLPSILGMAFAALMMVGAVTVANSPDDAIVASAREEMSLVAVPLDLQEQVVDGASLTEIEPKLEGLEPEQSQAVLAARQRLADHETAALGGGFLAGSSALCLGISFFVSGLLGWLLVMKKRGCSSAAAAKRLSPRPDGPARSHPRPARLTHEPVRTSSPAPGLSSA